MGSAMAANLVRGGFHVVGYDVLPERRTPARRAGGEPAKDVRALADAAAIIITSLPSASALMEVARSWRGSDANRWTVRTISSSRPAPCRSRSRSRRVPRSAASGASLLDCPLSGTGAQARTKDIVVYASGDAGGVSTGGAGPRRVLAGALLRGTVRQRIEDEVRGQPAGGDSQRRGGRGDGAGDEVGPRPGACVQGAGRRRGQLAHAPGPRADDGPGRLLVGRDDEARRCGRRT